MLGDELMTKNIEDLEGAFAVDNDVHVVWRISLGLAGAKKRFLEIMMMFFRN